MAQQDARMPGTKGVETGTDQGLIPGHHGRPPGPRILPYRDETDNVAHPRNNLPCHNARQRHR